MSYRKNGVMKKIMDPARDQWPRICQRPSKDQSEIEPLVLDVFNSVRDNGDRALRKYTKEFDQVDLVDFRAENDAISKASEMLSVDLKEAISLAYSNIYKFHQAQQVNKVDLETTEGVRCWQEKRPIEKVGLYIPGGTAPLFSTILMLAIPAKIAGCRELILCTPPDKVGQVHPAILYTARLCGVDKIFKVGGIQAIAAMTFGTETIPKVYKIFGPGNQYVTVAKQLATRFDVAIDMPAGPSELLVLADEYAEASFVASDLLSQAEHGVDSQVILVTTAKDLLTKVEAEVEEQLKTLPRRDIAQEAIENSKLIYFSERKDALEFVNEYGPEHYILCSRDSDYYLDGLTNAGSVFIGNYTPESAGDYASGTNHTLPTQGYAKQYSGVNLDSFLKSITFQSITEEGLENIGSSIELMAEAEGLIGHKNAVSIRLKSIRERK